ncbi:hypothetical protein ACFY64_34985 [Streptomyces collinus]|uniref:hypothetical protein n=1 Tax=Streptomyces collinus TaxID=42684 RepID=UPI0036C21012
MRRRRGRQRACGTCAPGLASRERGASEAELDTIEARYPGRATMTEALADAGISWAYLCLSEGDGVLAEEIRRGFGKQEPLLDNV